MKEEDVASLNQRLAQAGYNTLGEMVRAFTQGAITNNLLVEPLADMIADRIDVKMLTRGQVKGLHEVRSPGFEPGLQAWRACVLLAPSMLDQAGRRPHDPEPSATAFNR